MIDLQVGVKIINQGDLKSFLGKCYLTFYVERIFIYQQSSMAYFGDVRIKIAFTIEVCYLPVY